MEEPEITEGESLDPNTPQDAESAPAPEQPPESDQGHDDAEPTEPGHGQVVVMDTVLADDLLQSGSAPDAAPSDEEEGRLRAVIEALVYVAEEPITVAQLANNLEQPAERIQAMLDQLIAEYDKPGHGFAIREVAGGYRMATKPEHHDAVRAFAKSLKPPLKLSLPALETLAVIAYKQPVTAPEVKEIRGVQGTGVLNTLLDRKLIAEAGRKNVIGKPILYKTTKEFLIQFGLKDLSELPTLKEFEELRRMAMPDEPQAELPLAEEQPAAGAVTPAETLEAAAPETAEALPPGADPEEPAAAQTETGTPAEQATGESTSETSTTPQEPSES
jgi:segregation and condensation protein B